MLRAAFREVRGGLREIPRETKLVVGLIGGSQFVNHAYLMLFPPVIERIAADFGVTLAAVGLALGAGAAANTAFQLPFGYLADNYDRTLALALSSFVGAVGVFVLAAAPSFAWLVAGQVILGVGVAGHHPTHYPLISDATPEGLRGRAFSVYGVGGSLGFAAPPALIAVVLGASGERVLGLGVPALGWRHAVAFVGVGGLLYAAFVTAVFARRVSADVTAPNVDRAGRERRGDRPSLGARVRAELRGLAAAPGILALAVLSAITSAANWGFSTYAVIFLTGSYGVSLDTANLALTGVFVVGAGAILAGGDLVDRFAAGPVMVASYASVALLVGVLALGTGAIPALAAVALFLVVGGTRSVAGPARSTLTDDLSAADAVGTSFAVLTIGIMVGSAVAPPVFGYLVEAHGPAPAYAAIAGVAVAATVVAAGVVVAFAESRVVPRPARGD
jgi:MFS family permease